MALGGTSIHRRLFACLCVLLASLVLASADDSQPAVTLPKEVVQHLTKEASYWARLDLTTLTAKDILSTDLDGEGFRAVLTYRSIKEDGTFIRLVTLRRKAEVITTYEEVSLYGGCSPAEVAEVRVAIREQRRPSGPMFLSQVTKKPDNTYSALIVTDPHPLGGAGADVELWRRPDGTLGVTKVRGFKK